MSSATSSRSRTGTTGEAAGAGPRRARVAAPAGDRGEVFLVDDNFIGNKKAIRRSWSSWRAGRSRGLPVHVLHRSKLESRRRRKAHRCDARREVHRGLHRDRESRPIALKKTGKRQNVGIDIHAALDKLTARGLEVMAGFIVGFDGDGAESFEGLQALLREAPCPLAMLGLLTALQARLSGAVWNARAGFATTRTATAFARPNFTPTMPPERELLEGYAKLLANLYSPRGILPTQRSARRPGSARRSAPSSRSSRTCASPCARCTVSGSSAPARSLLAAARACSAAGGPRGAHGHRLRRAGWST